MTTNRVYRIFLAAAVLQNLRGMPVVQRKMIDLADKLRQATLEEHVSALKLDIEFLRNEPEAWLIKSALDGVLMLLVP